MLIFVGVACSDDAENDTSAAMTTTQASGEDSTGPGDNTLDNDSDDGPATGVGEDAGPTDDSGGSTPGTSSDTGSAETGESGAADDASTDGDGDSGGRADCDQCVDEAFGVGGACEATLAACTAAPDCLAYLLCIDECADDLACETACVDATSDATDVLIEAIGVCVLEQCPDCAERRR